MARRPYAEYYDDFDAPGAQQRFVAHERPVLADDHAGDLVQQDGARAHVTWRERRVHGRAGVDRRVLTAGVLERIRLAVADHRALLHPSVVPGCQKPPVGRQCGSQ